MPNLKNCLLMSAAVLIPWSIAHAGPSDQSRRTVVVATAIGLDPTAGQYQAPTTAEALTPWSWKWHKHRPV